MDHQPAYRVTTKMAHPATTNYFYFVADAKKGDGSHVFAETLEQHNQNVAQYGSP